MIVYKEIKAFSRDQIRELFLSVHWESGNYPEKVAAGLRRSSVVISAWEEERLVGLARALDDGETVAFVHYVLVNPSYQGRHIGEELMRRLVEKYQNLLYIKVMPSDPSTIPFYEKCGFTRYENYTAMEIKRL